MSEVREYTGVCRQSMSYSLKRLSETGFLEDKKELINGVYVKFYKFNTKVK